MFYYLNSIEERKVDINPNQSGQHYERFLNITYTNERSDIK